MQNESAGLSVTRDSDTAVPRDSLSDRIYERLRIGLMTGVYEPGERLNIRQLAQGFETSPTPVREAMMQLAREGALELRTGHLLRVPNMSLERYLEVRDVRLPLERLAAERAAELVTESELLEIQYQARRCVDAEKREAWKEAIAANQEFHFAIYKASGSSVLVRVLENLWLLTGPFINHLYPAYSSYRSAKPHDRVVQALRARDPAEAGEAVVHDIMQGSSAMVERWQQSSPALATPAPSKRRA
ncbi:MAG: AsnC family transcriptional regulator [Enterovirga sp.]|jgi:DNA-binding GntR family transcriptional regulator|nr:AsnC family transcriptional regulator [Enterovirga sp.]